MPYALKTGRIKVKDSVTGEYEQFDASSEPTVDATLSDSSTNPVQNQAIKNALDQKVTKTNAVIENSVSMGRVANSVIGQFSVALGGDVTASALASVALGGGCSATGVVAYAEGANTTASGMYTHAEGAMTTAAGKLSHAEGERTVVSSSHGHAEGYMCEVHGLVGHAEGSGNIVNGTCTHAEGYKNTANGNNQHVQGKWAIPDNDSVFCHIVGNGTANDNRSNAHTIDWNGNAEYAGDVKANACGGQNPVSLNAVASALNNKEYSHNYELIADITLSEDVDELIINKFSDNSALVIKDLIMECSFSAVSSTSYLGASWYDSENRERIFPTGQMLVADSGMTCRYWTARYGNLVRGYADRPQHNDSTTYQTPYYYNVLYESPTIRGIRLYKYYGDALPMPSGSRIRLWGVRV